MPKAVNGSSINEAADSVALREAREQAEGLMPAYYRGHWDSWVLARVHGRVRTKLGVAFEDGDVVLMDPATKFERYATAFSFRNKANTSVVRKCLYTIS